MGTFELIIISGCVLAVVGAVTMVHALMKGGLEKTKTRLSVLATAVGIVSALCGMLKECESTPVQNQSQQPNPAYVCCTPYGNCPMPGATPPGLSCTCWDGYGNYAQGFTCN